MANRTGFTAAGVAILERQTVEGKKHGRKRVAIVTTVLTGVAMTLSGCGSGLTGASTCADFMSAPPDQQDQVVNSLATQYQKPDFTSPLGRPEVPYYCAKHPDVTLDQFFAAAGS